MRTITLALAAGAVVSAGTVALASGTPPVDRGYPPPGVTAVGVASARVDASDTDPERAIRRAVATADARARPRAFADARAKAAGLARIAGVRLGAVWSVGQDPNVPYYGSGVAHGTFGPNEYCGRARQRVDGRRVWRHACRAPREVTIYLTVTFGQA